MPGLEPPNYQTVAWSLQCLSRFGFMPIFCQKKKHVRVNQLTCRKPRMCKTCVRQPNPHDIPFDSSVRLESEHQFICTYIYGCTKQMRYNVSVKEEDKLKLREAKLLMQVLSPRSASQNYRPAAMFALYLWNHVKLIRYHTKRQLYN